jgi:hypothetical protein
MGGIFPYQYDGGLPPNAGTPDNPAQAYPPTIVPVDTSALYYGNGCDVRLRPHVINSLISEIASIADRGEVAYRQASLRNLELATRYLIQRGLPKGSTMLPTTQDAFHFTVALDPPTTRYNDFLAPVLTLQQVAQNQKHVRLNFNGLGFVPLYRNDGAELQAGDILKDRPFMCSYWQGAFYMIGLVMSQVPQMKIGALDMWVRTDGNDTTGDGTSNDPQHAFRTIAGAYNAASTRFMVTPLFTINIKLGIPGDYAGCGLGPFGGGLSVSGAGGGDRWQYRIHEFYGGGGGYSCFGFNQCSARLSNLTMYQEIGPPNYSHVLSCTRSVVVLDRVGFQVVTSNVGTFLINAQASSTVYQLTGDVNIQGNSAFVQAAFAITGNSQYTGCADPAGGTFSTTDLNCVGAYMIATGVSVCNLSYIAFNVGGAVPATQYIIDGNSVLYTNGVSLPGNVAGYASHGGQVIG